MTLPNDDKLRQLRAWSVECVLGMHAAFVGTGVPSPAMEDVLEQAQQLVDYVLGE